VVIAPAQRPAVTAPVEYDYVPEPATTLAGGRDILVDEARGQVFVAQERAGLLVTDLTGTPVTTIAMPGAQDYLSLSADGTTVYLKVWDSSSGSSSHIMAVDTATHAVSTLAEAKYGGCWMQPIEAHSGLLWFVTSCETASNNDFGYIDPADGSVAKLPWPRGGRAASYVAEMAGVRGRPDRLLMTTGGSLSMIEVTIGDAVTAREIASVDGAGWFAATSDTVIATEGSSLQRYSVDDLSPIGVSVSRPGDVSDVAMRSDGTAATGSQDGTVVAAVSPDGAAPYGRYKFDRDPRTSVVANRILEWGSERLYVIVAGREFYAFEPRSRSQVELSRGDRARYRFGERIPITVSLSGSPVDRTVVVWHVDELGVRRRVFKAAVPLGDTLRTSTIARRTGQFEVTYPGDDSYDPSFDKAPTVWVKAGIETAIPSGRSVGVVRVHRVDQTVEFRAKVLPNHARDNVRVRVGVLVGSRWRHALSRWVRLNGESRMGLDLRGSREIVGYKFRVRLEFYGDRENTESFSRWRYFKFVR